MDVREQQVLYYKTALNIQPFREWRANIADQVTLAAIDARIARFRSGNFGDSRSIGGGASENRIDLGPGYRIYYGRDGNDVVVLLCGGNKSTQAGDIEGAKAYWQDYKKRKRQEREKNAGVQRRPAKRPKK